MTVEQHASAFIYRPSYFTVEDLSLEVIPAP